MLEPVLTGAMIIAGGHASKELLTKLLGPTAEYLGGGLRNWTERAGENVARVFNTASRILGAKVESPGSVSPRSLKAVLDEAQFSEEQLTTEYLGGVLASARSEVGRDDRAVAMMALLSQMSTYQIRGHYVIYSIMKASFDGNGMDPSTNDGRARMWIFMPQAALNAALDFSGGELDRVSRLCEHIVFGLHNMGLIHAFHMADAEEAQRDALHGITKAGVQCMASLVGMELFLWAHGKGTTAISGFLEPGFHVSALADVTIPPSWPVTF